MGRSIITPVNPRSVHRLAACQRVAIRPRATGAALTTSTQSRFCPRAPKTALCAAPARRARRVPPSRQTAYTTSESVLADGQVMRPKRQSDDPAARHWAGGGAACGGGAQGPSSPSLRRACATFIYVQAVASQVSLSIHAYHRPRPAYAPVRARSC